jgi:hypothetical protein
VSPCHEMDLWGTYLHPKSKIAKLSNYVGYLSFKGRTRVGQANYKSLIEKLTRTAYIKV